MAKTYLLHKLLVTAYLYQYASAHICTVHHPFVFTMLEMTAKVLTCRLSNRKTSVREHVTSDYLYYFDTITV